MEPELLKEGQKIAVPQAWLDGQKKQDERRENIGQWRTWLGSKQQEVLEKNPLAPFTSRIPIEALKAFTPEERDALMAHEEQAYNRHKPLATEKDERRRAFIAAGGTPEKFEITWREYGEHVHIEDVAAANLERAKRSSSPY